MLSDILKNIEKLDDQQVEVQFTPSSTLCVIGSYGAVVEHLEVLWRNKNGTDMVKERSKINKEVADRLTATGVIVRQAWVGHLRANKPITFDRAHKVFIATNNLLKKLDGPLIPESALTRVTS